MRKIIIKIYDDDTSTRDAIMLIASSGNSIDWDDKCNRAVFTFDGGMYVGLDSKGELTHFNIWRDGK